MITACSRAITRYCKRGFVVDTFDELYSGRGERQLLVRNFPIQSVQSVRYRPVTVLKVTNNAVNTPQARIEVLYNGLRLTSVTSGTKTIVTGGLTWAACVTIIALQNALNALGNGWSAGSAGYDQWPAADLYCPNASTSDANTSQAAGQGALQDPALDPGQAGGGGARAP